MPLISEYKSKKLNSFKKKSYRPWNIEVDSNPSPNLNSDLSTIDSINHTKKIENEEPTLNIFLETSKNEKQLGNKQVKIEKQLGNKQVTIEKQLGNELGNKQVTIEKHKKTGKIHLLDSVNRLCGLQRKILFYLVNQCLIRGQLSTGPITNESLRDIEKSDVSTIKTSLHRLIQKGWILREKGKTGRGGFASFKITENVRNSVLEELKNIRISKQLDNKQVTNEVTDFTCSSSINNNTTTNAESFSKIPNEWKEIDIQPLEGIKFTKAHLEQIFKFGKLEPQIVQDSIHAFAFDIQNNGISEKLKLSPLNVFMGIMKKGNPYLPPDNYETPEEVTLRKYIEIKRNQENGSM